MDKIAAEKIAQEYHNLGVKLAMIKVSNNPSVLRKIIAESLNRPIQAASGAAGLGLGSLGGAAAAERLGLQESLLGGLLMGGGAAAGALKGLQSAPKVMIAPELYWQSPGLVESGRFRLR